MLKKVLFNGARIPQAKNVNKVIGIYGYLFEV